MLILLPHYYCVITGWGPSSLPHNMCLIQLKREPFSSPTYTPTIATNDTTVAYEALRQHRQLGQEYSSNGEVTGNEYVRTETWRSL